MMRLKSLSKLFILIVLGFLTSCESPKVIVNDIPEREANEIIVFLATKDIPATKMPSPSTAGPAAATTEALWSIAVPEKKEVDAMAVLNRNGLPRRRATSILELFAKSGLISSEREENIRFQAGLASQIAGTIRKIDGVIDAVVELSIPPDDTGIPTPGGAPRRRATASVFVKHQGILDDPNSHLVTKIKRLVSGSITGLDINDVTVISDRSRFTDLTVSELPEDITPTSREYVSIWSIVMSKGSTSRFRFLFFMIIFAMVVLGLALVWMLWKFYPILRNRGLKNLFHPIPFRNTEEQKEEK